jgi:hypothetical protein
MKFPRIFTDLDKQRATELRLQHPNLSDKEIIARVIENIRTEIKAGKNQPLSRKLENQSLLAVKKKRTERQSKRVFLRRLPGSFEGAQR